MTTSTAGTAATTTTAAAGDGNVTLPLGDFNVVVVTDVHSWVGGHGFKEPHLNADYGHVLSFYQRLKEYCDANEKNVWFVMNGDWIDGTALSMNGDPSHLIPLLEKMPWDLVNIGNHELYRNDVIDYMTRPGGYVDWWGRRLLTSNIMHAPTSLLQTVVDEPAPIGNLYRILHGRDGQSVLAFGFLYNMFDHGNHVTVRPVEETVEENWFTTALTEQQGSYDAILVLAHMGSDNDLVKVILTKIRSVVGKDVPVQFITGHTHVRQYIELDSASAAMEAGRFLDTVGFVSFPSKKTFQQRQQQQQSPSTRALAGTETNATDTSSTNNATNDESSTNNASATTGGSSTTTTTKPPNPAVSSVPLFRYEFINASVDSLERALGAETLYTEDGVDLSKFIYNTQEEMGLHEVIGCLAEAGYYLQDRSLLDSDSLWRFFQDKVLPKSQFEENVVVVLEQGSWRYDLLGGGDMRLDDIVAVSPFNETFYAWKGIPFEVMRTLNQTMNHVEGNTSTAFFPLLPRYIFSPVQPLLHGPGAIYTLVTNAFEIVDSKTLREDLLAIYPAANLTPPEPMNLTTTGVWIDYFRQNRVGCTPSQQTSSNQPGGWDIFNSGGSSQSSPSSLQQLDALRLGFVVAAVMVVIALIAVYVRQRGILWRRHIQRREFQTMEAIREREEEGDFI